MQTPKAVEEMNELEDALKLMRSPEWKQFKDFQKRRCVRLQHGVNDAVRTGDITEARIKLALLEDAQKEIVAFEQQTLQKRSALNPKENDSGKK